MSAPVFLKSQAVSVGNNAKELSYLSKDQLNAQLISDFNPIKKSADIALRDAGRPMLKIVSTQSKLARAAGAMRWAGWMGTAMTAFSLGAAFGRDGNRFGRHFGRAFTELSGSALTGVLASTAATGLTSAAIGAQVAAPVIGTSAAGITAAATATSTAVAALAASPVVIPTAAFIAACVGGYYGAKLGTAFFDQVTRAAA